ncbi:MULTISPECIES: C40 family peptidase [unclassified Streptomyces]|uniref:C40 family peptidase n=1 Tax=unclassified Streptomyces TaxID=2593676 RepID=UPI002257BB2E|nr:MULTISPECIES: C40 family peptidase [unclassified Streptomyces]MCX4990073.1 NlpC/P60 family protein [Streptomyces sp. NBC_00568]MCX5004697.1 NlpC/P60 family protein [Streptomyces sp. NBC_00638]
MGSGKRSLTTAAMALACACACVVLATPGVAYASPTPTPAPTRTPTATPKPVSNKDLEAVRKKLEKLYHDAAVATDAYNAAEEKAQKQSAEIVDLAREIVKGQAKLDKLQDRAGAAARAQYRGGGLPPGARLWLSDDPQEFLDGAGRVRQGEHATKGLLGEMTRTQQDLEQYEKDASAQWRKLEANRKAKAGAKKKIKQRISDAKKLESQLERKEKERLAKLEEEAAHQAQSVWLSSGVLADIKSEASEQGREAVKYATDQIGKPYEWGAEGPKTFDCSGLTSQAWASAGHPIPRTSQEQWKQLKHVDVKDMRPGDLIIYFDDASHVGMYIGDGAVVHAPRPGRTVTIAGAGSMQILGVVRPDA